MRWYCGRCSNYVDNKCMMKNNKYACPLWYVPTTLVEKARCLFNVCKFKGTCIRCDNGPHHEI